MPLAVVAVGGNALARADEKGAIEHQFANARTVCSKLVSMLEEGWDLVLTHGNGPQVGNMLWRVELAAQQVHPVDLGICDANSQGQIGYMLQQVLGNELRAMGLDRPVVTLVTQVEIDAEDPAFAMPTKPIGPFFGKEDAHKKETKHGWLMREDAGRGWRRIVPSPVPKRIVELSSIRQVLRAGSIPIAGGGGGIPVVRRQDGRFDGVEAVVDKDLTASLMARRLAADLLIICTAVSSVSLNHGRDSEKPLREVGTGELERHYEEGQFPAGSMGPKVRACLDFVTGGGVGTRRRAVITSLDHLRDGFRGKAGTVVGP